MDFYSLLFWIGFLTILIIHLQMLNTSSTRHAVITITALSAMFLGSKIGRELLGIKK
jgi:Ni/Fe-hydrogenase subunit HybB-like protein